ncbi:MAG: hypothetical protein HDR22_01990 [Lachnospiraceae bacterium]|nr:hypothetical protein [Lachnospiraceae bacterium]
MKKSIFFLEGMMIAMLLSACGSKDVNNIEENREIQDTIENEPIEKEAMPEETGWNENRIEDSLCDNVIVDADVVVPEGFQGVAAVYNAGIQYFQEEAVMGVFGVEKEHTTNPAEGLYQYEGQTFGFANSVAGNFYYYSKTGDSYKVFNPYNISECANMENLGEGKDLDFMSAEEAGNKVLGTLSDMGIDNAIILHTYALPVEYHKYQEEEEVENGYLMESERLGEQWDVLGGCYELELTTCYDNIPLYEEGYVAADDSAFNGGKIKAIISKNGIEKLEIPNQYVRNDTVIEAEPVLSPDEILQYLKIKMENIILTDTYTVKKVRLCYLPSVVNKGEGLFQLIPIWEITLNGETDGDVVYLFQANDGVEIQW